MITRNHERLGLGLLLAGLMVAGHVGAQTHPALDRGWYTALSFHDPSVDSDSIGNCGEGTSLAGTEPADLNLWTQEAYSNATTDPDPTWWISPDGYTASQLVNSKPTVLYSDFTACGSVIEGDVWVPASTGDDDFIGFVLGFAPGDSTSSAASYILIDWKRGDQTWNFGYGPTWAARGLAASLVFGVPTGHEFWSHNNIDVGASDLDNGLDELQRGFTLGMTGWVHGQVYRFRFEFEATALKVYVDGSLELDLVGSFPNGRFGLYDFSQSVSFSGYTRELTVAVDVKPGSCPNPLNMKSMGKLPVAVVGTADFDVLQIDPATVRLQGVPAFNWSIEDVATPFTGPVLTATDCTSAGGDGFEDLSLRFETQDLVAALGAVRDGDVLLLELTGTLQQEYGGDPVRGEDVVVIIQK